MERLRHDILDVFGTDRFPTHDTISRVPYRMSFHHILDRALKMTNFDLIQFVQ
jgi:hypothetical protein